MKKSDFQTRSVAFKDPTYEIEVARTRTTAGFASIVIKAQGQTLSFTNEHTNKYEEKVSALIDLLEDVVREPCLIPPIEAQTKKEHPQR